MSGNPDVLKYDRSRAIGDLLSIIAAILSAMTGSRSVHETHGKQEEKPGIIPEPVDDPGRDIAE